MPSRFSERRQRLLDEGLCQRCGKQPHPNGQSTCLVCQRTVKEWKNRAKALEKQRERMRRLRAERKAQKKPPPPTN